VASISDGIAESSLPCNTLILKTSSGQTSRKALAEEYKLLSELDHPHIIRPIKFKKDVSISNKPSSFMALPFHRNGDLFDLVSVNEGFSEHICHHYFRQLVSALAYLHNKEIIHRDVKLENILINEQGDLELIDFGFAEKKESSVHFSTLLYDQRGTEGYLSPELIDPKSVA